VLGHLTASGVSNVHRQGGVLRLGGVRRPDDRRQLLRELRRGQALGRYVDDTQGDRITVAAHQYASPPSCYRRHVRQRIQVNVESLDRSAWQGHHAITVLTSPFPPERPPFCRASADVQTEFDQPSRGA
jgi:hypothetical protein